MDRFIFVLFKNICRKQNANLSKVLGTYLNGYILLAIYTNNFKDNYFRTGKAYFVTTVNVPT